MIALIVVILFCAPFVWWYFVLQKCKSIAHIPGPKPLPIIGNSLHMGNKPQDLFVNLTKFYDKYWEVFKIYIANELRVFISKPDLVKNILSSNVHITKSSTYDLISPWLGVGLLISTGKKWKARRKMITPTFHFKILDQFIEVFNSCGNVLVEKLSSEVGKESVDVYPFINLCSLDIICETSMGVKISAQKGGNVDYVKAVRNFLQILIARSFSAWKRIDVLFKFSKTYPFYLSLLSTRHDFTKSVIIRRRVEKSSKNIKQNTSADDQSKRKVALLDMLLESEHNNILSNIDLREEIDTFMFEGHDTTASGTSFMILALAEVQDKVYNEILSVIGDSEDVTMQQLQDTRYLEMVIKESQRLYPTVPFIERPLELDCNLGGYDFPKDTIISTFIYGLHHNAQYFPNPEKFDPNRFLPENQSSRHSYAYVPFSAGPRNCIGQKFAMLEMKTTGRFR